MINLHASNRQGRTALAIGVFVVVLTTVVQLDPNAQGTIHPIVGTLYGLVVGLLSIGGGYILMRRARLLPLAVNSTLVGIAYTCGLLDIAYGLVLPGGPLSGIGFTMQSNSVAVVWLVARYVWNIGAMVYVVQWWLIGINRPLPATDHPIIVFCSCLLAGILLLMIVSLDQNSPAFLSRAGVLVVADGAVIFFCATLTLLIFGTHTRLLGHLYLLVAGFSGACETILVAETAHRYTLSWYAGRVCGVVEALAFFTALAVQSWPLLTHPEVSYGKADHGSG